MEKRILEVIKEMQDSEIVTLWNEYCYATNHYDDEIMDQYRLEEYLSGCSTEDTISLLNRFYFGHDENNENSSANPNRNYFTFNGYGNIISFDYIYNQYTDEFYNIYIDDLIEYIISNQDALYNDEIQEIIDSIEE